MRHPSTIFLLLLSLLSYLSLSQIHAAPSDTREGVRFLMYNVKNYFVEGELNRTRYPLYPKQDASCQAIVDVISSVRPDIIGLIEIGGPKALSDLQARLAKKGLPYKYSRTVTRQQEPRALAILSRYPIVQDQSKANYGLYGQQNRQMLRGILDVTIATDKQQRYRIIGAHLKARNAKDQAEARSLRQREAETLSQYLAQTMKQQPSLPVLVYGDWNDEPQDTALRSLTSIAKLQHIAANDSKGQPWTLYYGRDRKYLILDQIYVNQALMTRLKPHPHAGIVDHAQQRRASDHRAIWCDLK